ncbi:hypothetical protein [Streptomyces sp. NPDC055058]
MGISYVGMGGQSQHADTITPALPPGTAAGQLAVLQVVSGHPDEVTPSTPAGWTRAGTFSGGGGSFGSGTGPRRLTWFVRELTGGDSAPTVSIPAATGSLINGRVFVAARSAGTSWLWSTSFGEDTSSGTGFSAACSEQVTFRPGDFVLLGYGIRTNALGMSAENVTALGVTFGSVTERADEGVSVGNLARMGMATCTVTSGAAAQPPTVAATLSGAGTGPAGVLRLRENTPKGHISVTTQSVFPPRNLVLVTEMLAGDVAAATLYRTVNGVRTPVRGASGVDVTAQDALVRIDGEQPFGVPVTYTARLIDSLGDESLVSSDPITTSVDADVISDAVRGQGAAVTLQAYPDKQRTRDASTFNVGGRMVVVSRRRSKETGRLTVRTLTDEAGDALNDVLDDATEGVVLIRRATATPRLDGYYAIPQDLESPRWFDAIRFWELDIVRAESWPDVLEAAGFTLEDLADNFSSLQDLADAFTPGTLLDVAIYDFGG